MVHPPAGDTAAGLTCTPVCFAAVGLSVRHHRRYFNHYGLFTDAQIVTAPDDLLAETVMSEFPTTDELASQVVEALRQASPGTEIVREKAAPAEFVNNVVLQVTNDELRHAVFINPVDRTAWVSTTQRGQFGEIDLLPDVSELQLQESPYELAVQAVPTVLREDWPGTDWGRYGRLAVASSTFWQRSTAHRRESPTCWRTGTLTYPSIRESRP